MAQPQSFTGIWRSTYKYTSSERDGEFENTHYLRAHQEGRHIIFESVPDSKSYVIIRLTLQDDVATGSWQEETELDGHYKGAIYHGAIQMTVSEDQKKLTGKWVGFGKDMSVNTGPWTLEYVGQSVPA